MLAGADPGFPVGVGAKPPGGGANIQFCKFPRNTTWNWEILGCRGDATGAPPLRSATVLTLGVGKKGKAIDFTSPRTSSGQASWPYETVPNGKISSPFEGERKPEGENHQALAVKGERHPTCGLELNPGHSGERWTCYHGVTKPQLYRYKSVWAMACMNAGARCLCKIINKIVNKCL